jgi:3-phenylpropionate/trans-cinnamate dioxygenase ferredoxin reductase component
LYQAKCSKILFCRIFLTRIGFHFARKCSNGERLLISKVDQRVVIIGAGHAGVQAAASLRDEGYDGAVHLLDAQTELPYQRPPLSKTFLKGETTHERIILRSEQFYIDQKIDLQTGVFVEKIEPLERKVRFKSGKSLTYSKLILATGAKPREMLVEGHNLKGIFSLRDVRDAQAIKTALESAQDIVVIGAGFIGLEFAATAAAKAAKVTVIEMQDRVMARAISPAMSHAFQDKHQSLGITFQFNSTVEKYVSEKDHVTAVQLSTGERFKAQLVVVGIGVVAKDRLALDAGLEIKNGLVVDEHLQTNSPNIFAVGDNNAHPNHHFGDRLRLESVQNAVDQAKHVASVIAGKTHPFRSLPWFWSDQADYKLQIVGVAKSLSHQIVRGDPEGGAFSILGFEGTKLRVVESLNKPADHMIARRLIEAGLSPSLDQAADVSFDLKSLLVKPV